MAVIAEGHVLSRRIAHLFLEVGLGSVAVAQQHEEALVRIDVLACIGGIVGALVGERHVACRILVEDGVARCRQVIPDGVDVVHVGLGEGVEVEVGLIWVAYEVVAVSRHALGLRQVVGDLVGVVQRAIALQEGLFARGGKVALARHQSLLVVVVNLPCVLEVVHVPVARAVALEVDPVVLGLVVGVEVPLRVVVATRGRAVVNGAVFRPEAVGREVAVHCVVLRVEAVVGHAVGMAVAERMLRRVGIVDAQGGVAQRCGDHVPVGDVGHAFFGYTALRVGAVNAGRVVERDAHVGLQRLAVDQGHVLGDVELGAGVVVGTRHITVVAVHPDGLVGRGVPRQQRVYRAVVEVRVALLGRHSVVQGHLQYRVVVVQRLVVIALLPRTAPFRKGHVLSAHLVHPVVQGDEHLLVDVITLGHIAVVVLQRHLRVAVAVEVGQEAIAVVAMACGGCTCRLVVGHASGGVAVAHIAFVVTHKDAEVAVRHYAVVAQADVAVLHHAAVDAHQTAHIFVIVILRRKLRIGEAIV